MSFKTINIDEGQNIFDISIQEYGTIESVWMVIEDNESVVDINTPLQGGKTLLIRNTPEVKDEALLSYFRDSIKVNTSSVELGGIGYMSIGTTFKVR